MNKYKKLLITGIFCMCLGGLLFFFNKNSLKNEDIITQGFDVQTTTKIIAKNNKSDARNHEITIFLLGYGLTITLFSGIMLLIQKKDKK